MYMFVYEGGRGGGVKNLEKMATWFVHDPYENRQLAKKETFIFANNVMA